VDAVIIERPIGAAWIKGSAWATDAGLRLSEPIVFQAGSQPMHMHACTHAQVQTSTQPHSHARTHIHTSTHPHMQAYVRLSTPVVLRAQTLSSIPYPAGMHMHAYSTHA